LDLKIRICCSGIYSFNKYIRKIAPIRAKHTFNTIINLLEKLPNNFNLGDRYRDLKEDIVGKNLLNIEFPNKIRFERIEKLIKKQKEILMKFIKLDTEKYNPLEVINYLLAYFQNGLSEKYESVKNNFKETISKDEVSHYSETFVESESTIDDLDTNIDDDLLSDLEMIGSRKSFSRKSLSKKSLKEKKFDILEYLKTKNNDLNQRINLFLEEIKKENYFQFLIDLNILFTMEESENELYNLEKEMDKIFLTYIDEKSKNSLDIPEELRIVFVKKYKRAFQTEDLDIELLFREIKLYVAEMINNLLTNSNFNEKKTQKKTKNLNEFINNFEKFEKLIFKQNIIMCIFIFLFFSKDFFL
jgi:hypothetical protein